MWLKQRIWEYNSNYIMTVYMSLVNEWHEYNCTTEKKNAPFPESVMPQCQRYGLFNVFCYDTWTLY